MNHIQPTQPTDAPVRLGHNCKKYGNSFPHSSRLFRAAPWLRHLANILPAFLVTLFAILSATPTHAATSILPHMATGSYHSLFVKSDGTLWAMGRNSIGQLGVGDTTDRTSPVQVATDVIAVAAGGLHSLFVTSGGNLWAMGVDWRGGIGYPSPTPVQVATNVIAVADGGGHSLFVTSDGNLWAMGSNTYGQFGDGTRISSTTPVQVATNVIAVAAGDSHSLYVTSDGKLWAMGDNDSGQLGDGTTTSRYSPVPVTVPNGLPVIAVSAGRGHSLYVTSDGTLWAMGDNTYGQLGDGTNANRTTPVQVMRSPGVPATNIIAVAAGGGHSLFMTSDGYHWAMGASGNGQLGDGTTNTRTTPVQVATNVIDVASGYGHSLYMTSNGNLWATGNNNHGQLGDGTTTSRASPVQVMVFPEVPATNVIAVTAGDSHSLYVTSDGNLWAMGDNAYGQLGDNSNASRTTPSRVMLSLGVPATNVIAVAAGFAHSLYVTSGGNLWAMGLNSSGQLGDDSDSNRSTPVRVATNVIAVAAGGGHSLFVTNDGRLWAMGDNYIGQLGDGTTTTRYRPVQVATNVIAVAAGYAHSMYVTSDGKLWAMGARFGTTPVQVNIFPGTHVVAMTAGYLHDLYLTSDGTLWAMGVNDSGQLGDGTTSTHYSPAQVATNVIAVAAGGLHSLFVTSGGNLWAMGNNTYGQLGDGTVTTRSTPMLIGTVSALPLIVINGTGSSTYAAGATVTITANTAPSGKVFDRWTTSHGGTFANANATTTTFTMPANATTITATYKDVSNPPSSGGGGGGATSLWWLAAALALITLRARRR